jgi:competence protein ComEA
VPASGAAPPPTTPEAPSSAPPPAVLYVSVTGLVHKPGLVRLPPGSRVADAIEAAGGAAKAADLTGLNLAQPLTDGDSVVVGGTPAAPAAGTVAGPGRSKAAVPGVTAGPTGSPTLVDLNTADQPALESLPGVGPVMASNILAWRTEHGAFTSVEQLQEISGIGPARYAQLAPMVTVSG